MSKKRSKKKDRLVKNKKLKDKKAALHSETKRGILTVTFFTLAVISFLSFFNCAGTFGQHFFEFSQLFFGRGFLLIPVSFVIIGLAILSPKLKKPSVKLTETGKPEPAYKTIFIGVFIFIFSVLGVLHILGNGDTIPAGGYLGFLFGYPLAEYLGFWAGLIILLALLIISILVIFNISLIPSKKEKPLLEPSQEAEQTDKSISLNGEKISLWQKFKRSKDKSETISESGDRLLGNKASSEERIKGKEKAGGAITPVDFKTSSSVVYKKASGDFKLPPLDFLEKDKGQPTSGDIKANINIIKRTLENFGIEVEMAEVNIGPTVTQYTLRPAQGIKLSRITALQNDLSLALAAHPLRIEAPIPGRPLVGIEIPNKSIVLVRLYTLLERPTFRESAPLTFALGRDVAGNPMFADLAQMPHLLVAGATGTGKTIALNNLIISLLYRNSPDNLKMILIDPKRVELTAYNSIPHLMAPVIVQSDKAVSSLRWAVSEMERRFEILQEAGKRDIGAYCRISNQDTETMPYLVIIIDELADLMSSFGREAEAAIVRLAQMARAVGIHLVVSTQRPSVEVITGLIKANITSRMAFQVASQIDSRTILDMAGSEKLLGNGDMLFLSGNSAKPCRIQGSYISDKEVKRVADYLRETQAPNYQDEVTLESGPGHIKMADSFGNSDMEDELCEEAKEIVIQAGKASASLLQRRLRVGYARAARLLDILEEQGVVGPADGAKPRNVFVDKGENEV
jgi:DNA segregation ATPase FtsK/SpoIIIE, S-DNA-T family